MKNLLKKVFYLYYDGFRTMTIGRKLWGIILIKLFVMFVILKLFFFHDFLKEKFTTDKEKSNYVIEQLTR
jgi:phosphoglycerol transferase MdoB-like AlkP superfamily enzyme